MTLSIHTRGLTRRFSGDFGVSDLDLSVPSGAVYGFLGPNGAGKTTTIRLLLGLLRPERGEILLHGQPLTGDHRDALAQVGALVESPSLYPHLSGRQNLEVTRRLLEARPRVRGSTRCSTSPGCATPPIAASASIRWACASGWRFRWRCWASHGC